MKRILSLVLCVVMLASVLASCDLFKPATTTTTTPGDDKPVVKDPVWDPDAEYTYNTYMTNFPAKWNNHTYETATEGEIIGYTELGFYTFDYNEAKDGFAVVPEMATQMPIDVTADYVGDEWEIEEGDTARAWKIVLRNDLRWEDGTPITAHDFVTSAQLLLNPIANNHRADSLYEGNMIVMGAEAYFKAGKEVVEDNSLTGKYVLEDLVLGEDGTYTVETGEPIVISLTTGLDWLGGYTLQFYVNYYTSKNEDGTPVVGEDGKVVNANFDYEAYKALEALADESGNVAITETSLALLIQTITAKESWGETAADAVNYMTYTSVYPEASFDSVGIKAVSDTELVLILEEPLKGFYLLYNLTGSWLVHEETYNKYSGVGEDGVYNSTYGTSVETYMSYGPYKLTTFLTDKQIVLSKNDQWYGYSDPAYADTYWTTKVVYDRIEKPEVAMQAFLQGKLDGKGLDVNQIGEYASSEYVYYTDGASTFFVAMNPDKEAFTEWEAVNPGKDKHIMTVKEFRMALSFSLDRASFNLACDPTGNSAFAVFNDMICSDPENGTMYRTTEYAKDVILEFWGISKDDIGEGKLYADKDEAISSITGYNLAAAKDLFNQAHATAIADGLMTADDTVEICIGLPSASAAFYVNGYEFLKNCWTEAVKGTTLEGKLTFTKDDTIGDGFSDALKSNQVNLLFGVGWQGSSLDPYNLMMAYTTPRYQYDPSAWDTSTATIDFEIDGKAYRSTVNDWTYAMMGYEVNIYPVNEDGTTGEAVVYSCGLNDNKPDERLRLFAALEGAILRQYDLLPLNNESSAALKGMQIKYGTEEYVYGVGRGGIKYMKYWYTDAEWDAFVASQGGELNYH